MMNDMVDPSDCLLNRCGPKELEKARLSIVKSLVQAHRQRDLLKIENLSLSLAALARYLRKRAEDGQTLLEFAVLLPILAVMLIATIDLTCGLLDRAILTKAASEACSLGTMPINPRISLETVRKAAVARSNRTILADDPKADVTATGSARGDVLEVKVCARQGWLLFSSGAVVGRASARYQ